MMLGVVIDSSTTLKLAHSVSSLHFRQAAHNRIKNEGWWQGADWSRRPVLGCLPWGVGVLALRPCALPTRQQSLVHSAHTTSTVIATMDDARL